MHRRYGLPTRSATTAERRRSPSRASRAWLFQTWVGRPCHLRGSLLSRDIFSLLLLFSMPMTVVAGVPTNGAGDRFLRALLEGKREQARAFFLESQNEATKALEGALASASPATTERYRREVELLKEGIPNAAPGEVASPAEASTLKSVYPDKDAGWRAWRQFRMPDARRHFGAALRGAEAGGSRWQRQHLSFLVAHTFADEGNLGESNDWLLRSWRLALPGRPTHLDAMIQENLGNNAQRLGDFQPALQSYHLALELYTRLEYREGIATTTNNLATLYQEAGNHVAALFYFRQCLAALQRDNPNLPTVENNIASSLLALRRTDEAGSIVSEPLSRGSAAYFQRLGLLQEFLRAGGNAAEGARLSRRALAEALQTGKAEFISGALCDALRAAVSGAEAARLLSRFLPMLPPSDPSHWRAYSLLADVYDREGNSRGLIESSRQALQHLRQHNLGADFEFNFAGNVLDVVRPWAAALVREGKFDQGLTVWEAGKALARGKPATLWRDFQKGLGPGCVAIDFCVSDNRVIAWVIRRETIACFVLPVSEATLGREIDRLLAPFINASNLLALPRQPAGARELHRLLIEPLEPSLRGADCWTVLPDGKLHSLPFDLLESGEGAPLLERAAIRYGDRLLAAPGTARGLRTFTAWLDGVVDDSHLLPVDAHVVQSWDAVRSGGGDILHYSGHSLLDEAFPARSTLTARNPVSARDIARSQLNYRLIVLSSCDSAGGLSGFGSGLVGLSAAFQAAGARQVIATRWPIDQHSSLLLGEFYRLPLREEALPQNLRRARLQFRKQTFRVGSHTVSMWSPYFWAPFMLLSPHYSHKTESEDSILPMLFPLVGLCLMKVFKR